MFNATGQMISTNELNNLNNNFLSFFNTFQRQVIIWRESTQNPIPNANVQGVFGLGAIQANPIYTYSQVNQTFPALITYTNDNQKQELATESNLKTTIGEVIIKVQEDAMNYIEGAKVIKITVDGRDFEIISEKRQKTLLNSILYAYELQSVDK